MPAEEKPLSPVPDTYVPPGGTPHEVQTGDDWASLARGLGIDPWDLIDFNFPGTKHTMQIDFQRACRHVNWYLREYVGCQTSLDRANWAFTSGLTNGKGVWKGGHIYLPPRGPGPVPPPPTPPMPSPPPCEMRRPTFYRLLNLDEQQLASDVFGRTLPPWHQIGIGNGLGAGGDPWTSDGILISGVGYPQTPNVAYAVNIGDVASQKLTSTGPTFGLLCDDYGRICDLFIHEMTHVWQYYNDSGVMRSSIWARSPFGAGYGYTKGKSWESYNKEQQAHIVQDWHNHGGTKTDDLYPYIRLVIRSGRIEHPRRLNLDELTRDVLDLRQRGLD
jgi:hypothetical protein